VRQGLFELQGWGEFGDSASVRLLGGFGYDASPAGQLIGRDCVDVSNETSLRNDGHESCYADFGAFLQDEFELVAFEQALEEGELDMRFAGGGSFLLDSAEDFVFLDVGEDYFVFDARVVEDDNTLGPAHPQDVANLMRLATAESYLLALKIGFGCEESIHKPYYITR